MGDMIEPSLDGLGQGSAFACIRPQNSRLDRRGVAVAKEPFDRVESTGVVGEIENPGDVSGRRRQFLLVDEVEVDLAREEQGAAQGHGRREGDAVEEAEGRSRHPGA